MQNTKASQPGMNCDASWRSFLSHADEASLQELFMLAYSPLYTYALKITRDPGTTQDAVQEVFINLWKYRKKLNKNSKAIPYLLRAVRNEAVRMMQKFKEHEALDGEASQIVFLPHEFRDESLDNSEKQKVAEGLNRLPPRQREILYLRFYEDLCFEDIATVLGITYQAAVNQSFRAITRLRKLEVFNRSDFYSV